MTQVYPLIPEQAFLYFPKHEQMLQVKNGQQRRIIFDGNLSYSASQRKKIAELKDAIHKKQKNHNLRQFHDNVLLRFLQATKFNNTDCIHALRQFKKWEQKTLPLNLTQNIKQLLLQGILYVTGRDYCYRPIIVVNVGKILQLAPKQELFMNTLGYFFQYIIENVLIQGQVQNWVCIIDLGNASVFSLGGTLVDTISFLSSTFRGRVHHSYLINAPSSIKWVWGMVKGALNQDQLRKLSLSSKPHLELEDFQQINQLQVEEKYGGKLQNLNTYWPIKKNPESITVKKSSTYSLISKQDYSKKYQEKQLKQRKICQNLINDAVLNASLVHSLDASQFSQPQTNSRTNSFIAQQQFNFVVPVEQQPPQIPVIPKPFSFEDLFSKLFW